MIQVIFFAVSSIYFCNMAVVIMSIVMLHLVLGFGWLMYKLEFQKKKNESE